MGALLCKIIMSLVVCLLYTGLTTELYGYTLKEYRFTH